MKRRLEQVDVLRMPNRPQLRVVSATRRASEPMRQLCPYGRQRSTGFALFELFLQQLVDLLRVRLALRRLHRLTDEETEDLFLAAAELFHLRRVGRDDLVDHRFDGAGVGDLF